MAGFIDAAVQDIDNRLKELKQEEERLLAARAALAGTATPRRGPGRPPRSRSASPHQTSWAGAAARPARWQHTLDPGTRPGSQPAGNHHPGDRDSDEDRAELPLPRDAEADR